jgi:hypothetical protein
MILTLKGGGGTGKSRTDREGRACHVAVRAGRSTPPTAHGTVWRARPGPWILLAYVLVIVHWCGVRQPLYTRAAAVTRMLAYPVADFYDSLL